LQLRLNKTSKKRKLAPKTGGHFFRVRTDYQDASNDVFFIVSGAVHVKLQSVSGREVLLREINAGDFFGELAAIDNQPRSAGIIAVTDVTVARMPASVFRTAVHSHPDVCDQLLALLASQIRMLANRVNEFTTLDARHRIYAELLRLSRPETERPGRAVVSPPPVTRRSRRALASVVRAVRADGPRPNDDAPEVQRRAVTVPFNLSDTL
jgi:CRP-like cAMP-binding protein